jgi:cobalt-precorrin 5A hydrolase/precorrin-3B C17-methyltransferase
VTALYNPRSQRRTELIEMVKRLFLVHRPANTPVVVASRVGREDEDVKVVALFDFDPRDVDMLTIVLIGSTTSRMLTRGEGAPPLAFTPRGYGTKR